jgi:hypothetical protein
VSETIFFGYPYYGQVDGAFAASVCSMLVADQAKAEPLIGAAHGVSGLYLSKNRNMLADMMLASAATWLLMVDTDVVFKPDLPDLMLKAAREGGSWKEEGLWRGASIVAADLPLGGQDHSGMTREARGIWVPSETRGKPAAGWHDGAATAVMMIHRSVLDKITKSNQGVSGWWFLHQHFVIGREAVEVKEDMAFCDRAKYEGERVWVTETVWAMHGKKLMLPNATSMKDGDVGFLKKKEEAR